MCADSSTTKISDSRTAVCFLDILGYRELVREAFANETRITEIHKIMRSVAFLERSLLMRSFQTPYDLVKEKTSVAVLSDSLVVSTPLSAVPQTPPIICLTMFLIQIASFYTYFLTKLRRFMRGSIAVGQFYQDTLDTTKLGNTFILSQALVEAYELTTKFARWPRILVSASVFAFVRDSGLPNFPIDCMRLDQDSRFYLDIYRPFFNESGNLDSDSQDLMGDIASVVREQMKVNLGNESVLEKLRWFKNYHNERLGSVLPPTLKIEDF